MMGNLTGLNSQEVHTQSSFLREKWSDKLKQKHSQQFKKPIDASENIDWLVFWKNFNLLFLRIVYAQSF